MMELEIEGVNVICSYSSGYKTLTCIFDEIREYYGLEKMGTHMIKIGGVKYTIYRIKSRRKDGRLIPKKITYLSEISKKSDIMKDIEFLDKVRKIFVIKDLCLMSPNSEGKIMVYKKDGIYYPISYVNHAKPDDSAKSNSALSAVNLDYWFEDENDYLLCIKNCLYMEKYDYNLALCAHSNGELMRDIIDKIDKQYYWYCNSVTERILNILMQIESNSGGDGLD